MGNQKNLTKISKYMSLILRHRPEVIGLTLDPHGWADVKALIRGIQGKYPEFNRKTLEEIVESDEKQRYSFDQYGMRIRANQGHSVHVDVDMEEMDPPEILYHGTGRKSLSSILEKGLLPGNRLFVHLSKDTETARKVGARHGDPVIFIVHAGQMAKDGYTFRLSANGVWQIPEVPVKYLELTYEDPERENENKDE
ncbi:MAG: RNA 2'-phosphotransferase [Lachnospiraceae bacterium]|nr:RNA 2'-phosphotransferase [Lachnospiraceae bacterium]